MKGIAELTLLLTGTERGTGEEKNPLCLSFGMGLSFVSARLIQIQMMCTLRSFGTSYAMINTQARYIYKAWVGMRWEVGSFFVLPFPFPLPFPPFLSALISKMCQFWALHLETLLSSSPAVPLQESLVASLQPSMLQAEPLFPAVLCLATICLKRSRSPQNDSLYKCPVHSSNSNQANLCYPQMLLEVIFKTLKQFYYLNLIITTNIIKMSDKQALQKYPLSMQFIDLYFLFNFHSTLTCYYPFSIY